MKVSREHFVITPEVNSEEKAKRKRKGQTHQIRGSPQGPNSIHHVLSTTEPVRSVKGHFLFEM